MIGIITMQDTVCVSGVVCITLRLIIWESLTGYSMQPIELINFLEDNDNISFIDDIDNDVMLFRDETVDWYKNDKDRATAVSYDKLDVITVDELMSEIRRGLLVEGITRITGYFTKTSSWNPGKRAELKDRRRSDVRYSD